MNRYTGPPLVWHSDFIPFSKHSYGFYLRNSSIQIKNALGGVRRFLYVAYRHRMRGLLRLCITGEFRSLAREWIYFADKKSNVDCFPELLDDQPLAQDPELDTPNGHRDE